MCSNERCVNGHILIKKHVGAQEIEVAIKCMECEGLSRQKVINRILRDSDVEIDAPKTFEGFEFMVNDFRDKVNAIRKFMNSSAQMLYFSGNYGTGKTHILIAILSEMILKRKKAYYVTAKRLAELFRLREMNDDDGSNVFETLKKIKNAECLIIDDLASERQTESMLFEEKLSPLLEWHNGKIIVSSNLRISDLTYGPRLKSRLLRSQQIGWAGLDYRPILKEREKVPA